MTTNADVVLTVMAGFAAGVGVGWWRCMVYARKLRHFDVNLDAWAHYDEHTKQAYRPRPKSVTLFEEP